MSTGFKKYVDWKKSKSGSNFLKSKDNAEIQKAQVINENVELSPEEKEKRDEVDKRVNRSRAKSSNPKSFNPKNIGSQTQVQKKIVSFQLLSQDSIDLSSDFNISATMVGMIREFQGRYNRETKSWIIPYKNYNNIFQALRQLSSENLTLMPITLLPIDFICLPPKLTQLKFHVEKRMEYIIDYSKDSIHTIFELPSTLLSSLYKFQKEGIEFGIKKNGRLLLADEMGVGKTIQGIGISAIFKEDWPVLVLCPSSLKFAWKDEITTWLKEIVTAKEIQIMKTSKDDFKSNMKYYIMSYDLSVRSIDKIIEKRFNFIIADEAHYMKNKDSKRSKNLIPIIQKCKRLLLLTGTPILAKPVEAYPILNALRPDVFHNFKEFGSRYCNPQVRSFGVDWSGSSNSRELHFLLSKLMIRRLKVNVLSELPPKKRQKVEIPTESKVLNQVRLLLTKHKMHFDFDNEETNNKLTKKDDEAANANGKDDDLDNNSTELGCFIKAYCLTGKAKIPGIRNYIAYLIDNSCKFLVFAHHLEVIEAIEEEVLKAKIDYIRIDGNVPVDRRHDRVKKFQTDDNCLVAILAITACATGLTLTKASTVVFAELHFTPAIMIQAEDRAHRIGQEHQCVNVHYLYARDTVDEVVFNKLREKYFVVSSTLDNKVGDMEVQKIKEKVGAFEKVKTDSSSQIEKEGIVIDSLRNKTMDSYFQVGKKSHDSIKEINLHEHNSKRVREFNPKKEQFDNDKHDNNEDDQSDLNIEKQFLHNGYNLFFGD